MTTIDMCCTLKLKYNFPEDETFLLFKDSIKSDATRKDWIRTLNEYVTFRKLTEYRQLIIDPPKDTQRHLIAYTLWKQKEQNTLPQTIRVKLSALRHYYWINYDEEDFKKLDWRKIRHFLGESKRAVKDVAYTHEQIAKLLSICPPKIKIGILAECQGGPRVGAYRYMKLKDLRKIEEHGIYRVHVYPDTKSEYLTYFGPEATTEIDKYLEYRKREGEILTPESYLIRDDFTSETVNNPKPITRDTLSSTIARYAVKAGIRTVTPVSYKRKEVMLTHGLRKFFKQWCRRSGLDPIIIEYLVGHRNGEARIGIEKLMMTYDPAVEEELLAEYLKAIDNLTINEEMRLKRKAEQQDHIIRTQDEALQRAMDALNFLQEKANQLTPI